MTYAPAQIWHDIDLPLIAILRGIQPPEVDGIAGALLKLGFRAIEIPLNSPDPFTSIGLAVQTAAGYEKTLIGAGTVLTAKDVDQVHEQGGNLIVSPNLNQSVVARTLALGMASFPGVLAPTEAHGAVAMGATGLKFFPANHLGPSGIAAISATLPANVSMAAVGGVGAGDFTAYQRAGVQGFGLGSSLYHPGDTPDQVRDKAAAVLAAYRQAS